MQRELFVNQNLVFDYYYENYKQARHIVLHNQNDKGCWYGIVRKKKKFVSPKPVVL